MVLDNASDAQVGADTFADSVPASDDDPYNTTTAPSFASTQNYNIDTRQFPRPIPVVGALAGYTDALQTKLSHARLQHAAQILQRPPTLDEATALSYWTAKQISIMSYAAPIGVAGGAWRCYTTADTFRFPFFKPDTGKFNTFVFPNEKMAFFKGSRAVMAWHALRFASYGTVGNFIAQVFFGSYSMSVTAVGEMGDSRLKTYMEKLRSQMATKRGSLPNPTVGRQEQSQQRGRAEEVSTASMGSMVSSSRQQDDASPTGGMFFDEVTENGKVTGPVSEGVAYTKPPPQTQRRQWPQRSSQGPGESDETPFDPFETTAPTTEQGSLGSTMQSQSPQSTSSSGSGSAWDRIRTGQPPSSSQSSNATPNSIQGRQAQSNSRESAWAKARQRNGGTSTDGSPRSETDDGGFSAVRSEEERRYAKEDAQREFDARVERERRGGDFTAGSGGGDQKRW